MSDNTTMEGSKYIVYASPESGCRIGVKAEFGEWLAFLHAGQHHVSHVTMDPGKASEFRCPVHPDIPVIVDQLPTKPYLLFPNPSGSNNPPFYPVAADYQPSDKEYIYPTSRQQVDELYGDWPPELRPILANLDLEQVLGLVGHQWENCPKMLVAAGLKSL